MRVVASGRGLVRTFGSGRAALRVLDGVDLELNAGELVAEAERSAASDAKAVEDYRAGRTVHPLLPFREWEACQPALERLGAVYVAGARDGTAARHLGFIPIGSIGAAREMALGQHGPDARIGFLLAPPYFPLKVGVP